MTPIKKAIFPKLTGSMLSVQHCCRYSKITYYLGGYDASQQILLEVQEVIASNYDSIENAYEFFLSIENQIYPSNTQVSYHGFQKALEALLPKRFTTQQITYLWNSCSLDKKSLSLRAFTEKFNNKKFTGSSYLGLSK